MPDNLALLTSPGVRWLMPFSMGTICLHTIFLLPCLPLILQLLEQILIFIILSKVFSLTSSELHVANVQMQTFQFLILPIIRKSFTIVTFSSCQGNSSVWLGEIHLPPSSFSFWPARQPLLFSIQTLNVRMQSGFSSYLTLSSVSKWST